MIRQIAEALPQTEDPEAIALGVFSTLIGALQLARAVEGTELSDRILSAGKAAARTLIKPLQEELAP